MEASESSLIIILVVGTSLMLFLAISIASFVVYYQKRMLQNKMEVQQLEAAYQKKLLQSAIDSQEKERKRIASDLHDGVGAMLSAVKLNLNMLKSGAIPKEELNESIGDSKNMIDETIETVRRISKDLLPSSLESFGLSQAINELCDKLSNPHTDIIFKENGSPDLFESQKQLLIYRIIQELINNALKHAEASEIIVAIYWQPFFNLIVEDNGKGFDPDQIKTDIKKGVGLYNLESRASLMDGDISFESKAGTGTKIQLVIDGNRKS